MSRYRMSPTHEQDLAMREHCSHARFIWNLAVEQNTFWISRTAPMHVSAKHAIAKLRHGPAPAFAEQCRQLAQARQEFAWLRSGSSVVQQQALRDFAQALSNYFAKTHDAPTYRKRGINEGFRIVDIAPGDVRRLSRNVGEVKMPKIGWVRFRWSRHVPEAKSYRVTLDSSQRWHVAFAVIPESIPAPGNGESVGVDRGVMVSAAMSDGQLSKVSAPSETEARRLLLLERKLSRCKRGSNRRKALKVAIARLKARETDRRKDWAEKLSTDLARRFDTIGIEDLKIANMTRSAKGTVEEPGRNVAQKAGLNRAILTNGWGLLADRLVDKAPGRVVKVPAAYTSQRCSACGIVDSNNRKSQADFECTSCGFAMNADVNAARNVRHEALWMAAGRVVTARAPSDGDSAVLVREPQLVA